MMVNELFRLGNFQCRKVLVITRPGSVFHRCLKKVAEFTLFSWGPSLYVNPGFYKTPHNEEGVGTNFTRT